MDEEKKHCIIGELREKYRAVRKKCKGEIIDQLVELYKVSRKHAVRLLGSRGVGRPKNSAKRGRHSKYRDIEFINALRKMWRQTRYMCSKYLHAAMPDWLPYVEVADGAFEASVKERLLSISAPTIDRVLHPYKAIKGKSFTKDGGFREEIPIQTNIWDIKIPGFTECDTVAHCGGSLIGEFVWSLTMTDIAITWTEVRAIFGHGSGGVVEALMDMEQCLPFELKGYDSDNGTEVLNQHILNYFIKERIEKGLPPVQVTRSREYKKNDNAHVEQRNDSFARRYLGYERLEFLVLLPLINHYYANVVCPLQNHFIPSFKLQGKVRIKSHTRRIYAKPVTPYSRVMASPDVSEARKQLLKQIHDKLNPVALVAEEKRLRKLIDQAVRRLRQGLDIESIIRVFRSPGYIDIKAYMASVQPKLLLLLRKPPSINKPARGYVQPPAVPIN